jgi:hypothetical protein
VLVTSSRYTVSIEEKPYAFSNGRLLYRDMCNWENKIKVYLNIRGTWWYSCLRYSATSRKVAGSTTDGVIRIFH